MSAFAAITDRLLQQASDHRVLTDPRAVLARKARPTEKVRQPEAGLVILACHGKYTRRVLDLIETMTPSGGINQLLKMF